ncbi:class I SAM-dependent methyltransferase [Paucisalibacillus globulus]|uniref:class I SAM-dependent methyltransferase n=1 Tax=Paucisalibacillus globulus TaxID=351095 RepID=UPI000BB772A3|nr:methyltransferase domain-containing protein [Paucisalibacillus globulus]
MKKNLDKLNQAYYYEYGKEFGFKVRSRVHWILEKASGDRILDVGCSQGLISILLGREGKDVTGIDINKSAIDYANNQLSKEEDGTKKHVKFLNLNFSDFESDEKFDVIIMGEILEHITDTARFINKATKFLHENGLLIITVPFGVNDYFDHKKTYYLSSLVKFSNFGVNLKKVKFFGKWVGAVYKKEESQTNIETDHISINIIEEMEEIFEEIERKNINEILKLKKIIDGKDNNSKIESMDAVGDMDEAGHDKIKKLHEELEEEKMKVLIYKRKLIEQQNNESRALNELKVMNNRYNALKKSKLGQITLKYWQWKKSRG